MHDEGEIDEETGKPTIILDYNSTKGGVDSVDQKCANYSTARKTRRWPLALFFRFLDMTAVNSFVIYVANNMNNHDAKKSRMDFLEGLGISLMTDHLKTEPISKPCHWMSKHTCRSIKMTSQTPNTTSCSSQIWTLP